MLPLKVIPHMPKEELQNLVKHEKSARKLKRLQAILWCYKTNYYVYTKRIASKIYVTPSTICNWVHAWNKKGLDGLKIGRSSGKKPVLDPKEQEEFIRDVTQNPRNLGYEFSTWTLKSMKMHMHAKFGKTMSLTGIFYMLRRHNVIRLVPRAIPAKGDKKKARI